MDLNLCKYFNKEEIEKSQDDSDYIPEQSKERTKKIKKLTPEKCKDILKQTRIQQKIFEKTQIQKWRDEQNLTLRELTLKAKIFSNNKSDCQLEKTIKQKTYSYGDKLFVLDKNKNLQEIEHEKQAAEYLIYKQKNYQQMNYLEKLQFKNEVMQTFIENLNDFKTQKINSLAKSKYDWRKFLQIAKQEKNVSFYRKDPKFYNQAFSINFKLYKNILTIYFFKK